jgi:Arc/MetJ-type ribon-helix-helix transcriptional regulator
MPTVTVKLPRNLALRLRRAVARRGTTQSEIIRGALEAHLGAAEATGVSCLDVVGDLAGSLRGGPRDLSSDKRHLKGFGR